MCDGDDPVQVIVAYLLNYFAVHTGAADSIEGIRRWWLPNHLAVRPAELEAALEQLVQAGELTRRQLPDFVTLYARQQR
jgi:hypothetical protein